ncbi:hypothetical protein ACGF12_15675 [Kitasatospora sp. NPDC048296]|uniref:hypothetical protein n=1 Tax=Kitasatospora sp. NPDC048296 TaxID=3364048 RepID=UPI003719D95A
MDPADTLADLDAHPWASVSHAYGPAEDLPDLLRALAEGGGDAEEAISELYSCILHQGTVYAASADAVPYLARIAAAAEYGAAEVLCLLGGLAESEDECEVAPGAVRAAVAAQIPVLKPLLAHEEADVRSLAGAEPTTPQLDLDIAIATALWQIVGEAEEAVTILASVLDRTAGSQLWYRWTVVRTLRAIRNLGTAARPLVPRLEQLLSDPEKAPAAVLALLDVADPDTVDLDRLAEAALHSAETGADVAGACEALQALGAAALSTHQRLRVAELAEGDRRIVGFGLANSIVREDERLRAVLAGI